MLTFVCIYEIGCIISWLMLLAMVVYTYPKYFGIPVETVFKEIRKTLNWTEIFKVILYAVIWPLLFGAFVMSTIEAIRMIRELNTTTFDE